MNAPTELKLAPEVLQPRSPRELKQDPYLTWARLSDFRYVLPKPGDSILVAGKLRGPTPRARPRAPLRGRFILDTSCFVAQVQQSSMQKLAALAQHADIVLAEPGMQSIVQPRKTSPTLRYKGRAPDACSRSVVIGVVDGLCAFANEQFCAAGTSKLDFFWDQGTEPGGAKGLGWKRPNDLPYGRELDRAALNRIAGHLPPPADPARARAEQALYRRMGHTWPEDADWSHGTHILDTVLRQSPPGTGQPSVIYVQLPEVALRDTSARWMAAYVLHALHYIVTRAGANAEHIVVNLSLGAFAGPHDGSSLVERAIDEVVEQCKGRLTVVVAAGNAGRVLDDGTGVPKACHARVVLEPENRPKYSELECAELVWDIDVPDDTETFMEIWVPGGDPSGVSVSLRHEALGHDTGPVQPGRTETLPRDGSVFAAVINATGHCSVPNGEGGMVLVALGHTSSRGSTPAPLGRWLVKVINRGSRPLTFDAWIERRDVPGELAGFRPQYGFGKDTPGLTSQGSLGTLANGHNTIVVGAAEWDRDRKTYFRSSYSSADNSPGAGNCNVRAVCRRGPDVYGEGQQVAAGYFSGSKKGLAGTSMAAAQVSATLTQVAPPGSTVVALNALYGVAKERHKEAKRESEPRLAPEYEDERRSVFVLPAAVALDVPSAPAEQQQKEAKGNEPRPAPEYEDEPRTELVLVADPRVVASRATGTPRPGPVTSAPANGQAL